MTKIQIPEGMLKAVANAIAEARGGPNSMRDLPPSRVRDVAVEATLRWLSENPIAPTDEIIEEFRARKHASLTEQTVMARFACEWQRRMFLAPEPEIPEEIKDLLYDPKDGPTKMGRNDAVLEAFYRGRASR